jgi:signal transduction histidine kinase/DNA-binding response OmpR family regulator
MLELELSGDTEMARLIRTFDWSRTPLGPTETWSPALRAMVRFLLANRFPLLLWWGPDYVSIYNDAYRPVLGTKHPQALGQPVRECWREVWHVLQPLIDTPFRGGPSTWNDDLLLELDRRGFIEEAHFTIAYSPVPDDTVESGIGGVLATVHETTGKVVGDRRVTVLRDLATRPAEAKTAEAACAIAAETLAAHTKDVPFALIYLIEPDRRTAKLAGAAGVMAGEPVSPATISLEGSELEGSEAGDALWPLAAAMRGETMQMVTDLGGRLGGQRPAGHVPSGHVPPGPWADAPHTAMVVPIKSNKAHHLAGFLVAGISARLQFDDAYRDFLTLVASQIATSIANGRLSEEETQRAEVRAALDRAKTLFFSNVSHEFRTPLMLMLGPIEQLLVRNDTEVSPDAKGQLEVTHRNSLRLLRLVNTLLDFSRIEAGRVEAVFEPTDLAAVTAELASVFRSATGRAGLRLLVDCPPLAAPVYVDREMWEKIVLNLISNAFKFTFDGEIAVSLRIEGEAAHLVVRDTGVGIPAEEMPRLFDRFHRVPNMKSRTHEGSGIGLALVEELVRQHGGSIRAESRLDHGSAFTVSLPLGTAHLPQDRIGGSRARASTALGAAPFVDEALRWLSDDASLADPEPLPGEALQPVLPSADVVDDSRPRVLVADDNADMRHYLARLLAGRYTVQTVPDGQAALEAARARRPDLILSDVMMPRLDGIGLLRELRAEAHLKTVPVILLSARAGEESRVEGLHEGADDYLVKPFTARELLARVKAHLDMARLRRENEARAIADLQAMTRLYNVSNRCVRAAGEDPHCLEEIVDAAIGLTQAEKGSLQILDPKARTLKIAAQRGFDEGFLAFFDTVENDATACGVAMLRGEQVIVEDVTASPVFSGAALERLQEAGVRAVHCTPLTSSTGAVLGMISTHFGRPQRPSERELRLMGLLARHAADYLERKEAEQKLRDSEERFRAFISATSEVVFRLSPDGTEMRYLQGREFVDHTLEPSRTWLDKYIHPDDQPQVLAAIQQAVPARSIIELEQRVIRRDGSLGWMHTRAIPILDDDGEIVEWFGAAGDVTLRKAAEAALHDSEERERQRRNELETILSAIPAAVFIAEDRDCRRITANRAACQLVRIPEGGNASKSAPTDENPTHFEIYSTTGEHLAPDQLPMQRAAATGAYIEGFEHELRFSDGDRKLLLGNALPLFYAAGNVRGAVGAFLDITERKHQEEQIRLLLREVNHRSKNMLALVQAVARQTAVTSPDDFLERFTERIHSLAAAQDLLIRNDWRSVPLGDLICVHLAHFADLVGSRISIAGPPVSVTPTASQTLGMVMHELATNAAKHGALSTSDGRIDITWSVEIDGALEPPFTISWREHGGPTVQEPARRGFGSTVISKMVERSVHGEVVLDYAPSGLTWRLTCPAARITDARFGQFAAGWPPSREALKEAQHGSRRILVVEDEPLVASEITAILANAGFDVMGPVTSVKEALALLEHGKCDIAVLDVNLCDETSEPIAQGLMNSGTPFVVVSGCSRAQHPEVFRNAPLIGKPLRSDALVAEIERCLQAAGTRH